MNLYAYVQNDPISRTDPSGLGSSDAVVWGRSIWTTMALQNALINRADIQRWLNQGRPLDDTEVGQEDDKPPCDSPGADPSYCNPVVTGRRPRVYRAQIMRPPPGAGFGGPERMPAPVPRDPQTPDRCTLAPESMWGVNVRAACYRHDVCYGTSTRRSVCDTQLYSDIYAECRRTGGDQATCFVLGFAYYAGVRAGGWLAYDPPDR